MLFSPTNENAHDRLRRKTRGRKARRRKQLSPLRALRAPPSELDRDRRLSRGGGAVSNLRERGSAREVEPHFAVDGAESAVEIELPPHRSGVEFDLRAAAPPGFFDQALDQLPGEAAFSPSRTGVHIGDVPQLAAGVGVGRRVDLDRQPRAGRRLAVGTPRDAREKALPLERGAEKFDVAAPELRFRYPARDGLAFPTHFEAHLGEELRVVGRRPGEDEIGVVFHENPFRPAPARSPGEGEMTVP